MASRDMTGGAAASRLIEGEYRSDAVGATVGYRALVPAGVTDLSVPPLVLRLHGAQSSSRSIERRKPMYDALWASGEVPPMVLACADGRTDGAFYLDQPGGPRWETLFADEFPATVAAQLGTAARPAALLGASMGGYGVLKLAFAHPGRYQAVAALAPVVFPAETREAVPARNVPGLLAAFNDAMAGDDLDASVYLANSVYGRLRANLDAIRTSPTALLVDCGLRDEYLLHEGAEFLHRMLWDAGVPHDFRLDGASGHMGPEADRRELDALRFIGRALAPPAA